jgi:Zn-dependent peptidase ImmA (M78 family)
MRHRVPFRRDDEILAAVEKFRCRDDIRPYANVPVDVFSIAEIALCLDPLLASSLYEKFMVDAAISFDLSGIYIDKQAYEDFENGDRWEEKRLRFSIAHEIGHCVLHRKEILAGSFESIRDFRKWAGRREDCTSAEYQAYEFAGRLLVPRNTLLKVYDECCASESRRNKNWREQPTARSALAKIIAPRFGVNRPVIEYRFNREGIWPAE